MSEDRRMFIRPNPSDTGTDCLIRRNLLLCGTRLAGVPYLAHLLCVPGLVMEACGAEDAAIVTPLMNQALDT